MAFIIKIKKVCAAAAVAVFCIAAVCGGAFAVEVRNSLSADDIRYDTNTGDAFAKGNVVIIQATPGASRGINLEAGFEDALQDYPDITLLDKQSGEWLTEKANEVMRDFLTKYDQIDGVFCANDAMAEGASQAAEALGRLEGMQIWGADGETKALEYIEQGKMTGTIYTNCFDQGKTAFRLMLYALSADIQPSQDLETPVVKMGPIVATQETLDQIPESIRW